MICRTESFWKSMSATLSKLTRNPTEILLIFVLQRFLISSVQNSIYSKHPLTYQGSSVGSQHTKHTLQVKHMALSSPDEVGYRNKTKHLKFI